MTILTKENAHTAATVRNIIFPEWGIKRFQHEVQQGAYGEKYAVVGSGVSTTRTPGQEQYEKFTTGRGRQRKVRVQYDYRDLDDQLFSCVASTLEAARAKRDAWLEQKKAA